MKIRYEEKSEIPEDLLSSFTEFKEGDATVYLHKDLADQKKDFYRLKGDYTDTKKRLDEQSDRMNKLITAEDERQREKDKLDLESKTKNGQHQEIIDDLKSKLEAKDNEWSQKYDGLLGEVRDKEKRALISDLSQLAAENTKKELSRLISMDLAFDENGAIIVLDENGKATSSTLEEYKESLPNMYPSLVAEVQPSGGMGKGSTGGTGGNKKPEDYTEADRVQLFKNNPEQFKQIFNIQ